MTKMGYDREVGSSFCSLLDYFVALSMTNYDLTDRLSSKK